MPVGFDVSFKPVVFKRKFSPAKFFPVKAPTVLNAPRVAKSDSVHISSEAEERRKELDRLLAEGEEKAKAERKLARDRMAAMEIARRIMQGDRVPKEDEDFLVEYDPGLYLKAKSLAMAKEEPDEHDRLSGEDEEEASSDGGGDCAEGAAAPEAGEAE